MYEATITILEGDLRIEQEKNILKVVKEIGIDVDKEELLKALKYDREQYEKGYKDGYIYGMREFWERLKQKRCAKGSRVIYIERGNELLKEMVGEE